MTLKCRTCNESSESLKVVIGQYLICETCLKKFQAETAKGWGRKK